MCVRRVEEIVAYYYRTGGHDEFLSLSIAAIDCEGMRMEQDSRPPLQRRDGLQKESPQSRKQDMGSALVLFRDLLEALLQDQHIYL